jgi:GNAT superfamily N-acetyltransferase
VAIRIELLTGQHDRKTFECGEPSLNDWLARMALQQQAKNYARTRVVVAETAPARILGYYTLLAHEIDTSQLPNTRKLPQRLACVLLGRLAVDRSAQGRRLGRLMLLDAVARTRTTIGETAGIGLVVDALNERAATFYHGFGFEAFKDDPHRLFLRVDWP